MRNLLEGTIVGPASGVVVCDPEDLAEPRCRVCGCSEDNGCHDETAAPCYWVDRDLCNLCAAVLAARGRDIRVRSREDAESILVGLGL